MAIKASGGRGKTCPKCGTKNKFRNVGNVRVCSACHCIGWSADEEVTDPGSGKGIRCPACGHFKLVVVYHNDVIVRRCSHDNCGYSLVVT